MRTKNFRKMVGGYVKAGQLAGLLAASIFWMNLDLGSAQVINAFYFSPYVVVDVGPVQNVSGLSNTSPARVVGTDSYGNAFTCVVSMRVACQQTELYRIYSMPSSATAVSRNASGVGGFYNAPSGNLPVDWGFQINPWDSWTSTNSSYGNYLSFYYAGACYSTARGQVYSVNTDGTMAGECDTVNGPQPIFWNNNPSSGWFNASLLPTQASAAAMALGMNSNWLIVGEQNSQAVAWVSTTPTAAPGTPLYSATYSFSLENLGLGYPSRATGISEPGIGANDGYISGNANFIISWMYNGYRIFPNYQTRGFIKNHATGAVAKTLLPSGSTFNNADALKVNNSGIAVGFMRSGTDVTTSRATIWNASGAWADLNSQISNYAGALLTSAVDINDNGDVLVLGTYNGQQHGFVLFKTPTALTFNTSGY